VTARDRCASLPRAGGAAALVLEPLR